MLNKFALALVAFGTATASHAVTAVFTPGAPDPGAPAFSNYFVDFDSALPAGTALSGSYNIVSGSIKNVYAAPAGDTSQYLYVSSTLGTKTADLTTPDLDMISFYWGSVDKFNTIRVLGDGGAVIATYTGNDWPPANGSTTAATSNGRVAFTADLGETITGLRFSSKGVAFEVDSIAGLRSGGNENGIVPEPATWAMFVIGFGMVGASVRRRNRSRGTVSVTA